MRVGEDVRILEQGPVKEVVSRNGDVVVRLAGELDLYNAPSLREALFDAAAGAPHRLVVDLSEVAFMDSTALGVLIGAVKRLRTRDGVLVIVNVDANIQKTFEITGLDQIFTILETRDAAVQALDHHTGTQT